MALVQKQMRALQQFSRGRYEEDEVR